MPPSPRSICIVSHNAYGALAGTKGAFIGGVERQTSFLARWLAARGHRVSLVTWQEGPPDDEVIDGVRVIKVCPPYAGLPGLRFFHPKWTGLNAALRRADAEVYYHNCGECFTGQIALWCRRHGRGFVFSVASDEDCSWNHKGLPSRRERLLFQYGLRRAGQRVVQTSRQAALLRENFALDSVQVPMPCPEPDGLAYQPRSGPPPRRVIWVGRLWFEKRPQLFLDLAASCPDLQFDLVGPGFDPAKYGSNFSEEIAARGRTIPNVTVHGALPREQIFRMYDASAFLCCTSEYEGFPNTFLEAWSRGLPILSTFDPDQLIARRQLGHYAPAVAGLRQGLQSLLADAHAYTELSRRCRDYFTSQHTVDSALPRLEEVLIGAAASRRQGASRND